MPLSRKNVKRLNAKRVRKSVKSRKAKKSKKAKRSVKVGGFVRDGSVQQFITRLKKLF